MPSAQGPIQSHQPGQFTASFDINGSLYLFSGRFNPPTQPFESAIATLEYNFPEGLEGSQEFTGTIGSGDEVSFTFSDGTTIKWPLDIPINPASHVTGGGVWSQG
ncbi:hypothetical protein FMUND_8398 [Fusarium mundagurra]|uniref:Uncharacterized protein n=1 Tax=Fusarium mundagurra TaxID=1567541 RepID=A0A8H5YJC7_9HYPO|nr:hypothetical protein FMUND_8398 [Fusarium mundagurra]